MSKFAGREWDELGLAGGQLDGQVAVVTGGGRGIGRELALILARLGSAVAIAELSDEGERVAEQICLSGGQALAGLASNANRDWAQATGSSC